MLLKYVGCGDYGVANHVGAYVHYPEGSDTFVPLCSLLGL